MASSTCNLHRRRQAFASSTYTEGDRHMISTAVKYDSHCPPWATMQHQQQGEAAGGGAELQLQLQMRGGDEEEEEEELQATWDCGSPLYDSFELASLHYVLEKHTMVLPFVPDATAAAVSRSRRHSQRRHHHHRGGGTALPPNMAKTGGNRGGAARRTTRGSKAAAAIFKAVTCWRRSSVSV